MARFRIFNAVTTDLFQVFDTNNITSSSSTSIVIGNSDGTITTIVGTGLSVIGGVGQPGGVITSITRTSTDGTIAYETLDQLNSQNNNFANFWNAVDATARFTYVASQVDDGYGSSGIDLIYLGGNDGNYTGFQGNDTFVGNSGFDFAHYAQEMSTTYPGTSLAVTPGTQGVIVNLSTSNVTTTVTGGEFTVAGGTAKDSFGDTDTFTSIEGASGTFYDDYFQGNNSSNQFRGLSGNDTMHGGGGTDEMTVMGPGTTTGPLAPTHGIVVEYAAGNNFDGVVSNDGYGTADVFTSIERVRGSNFGDLVNGNDADNSFRGLGGADTFHGGAGFDTIDYSRDATYAGTAGVNVNLGTGTATDGFGASDSLDGVEAVIGTAQADTITGSHFDNDIIGGSGNDTLVGGDGNDFMEGGAGADVIDGSPNAEADMSYADKDTASYADGNNGVGVVVNLSDAAITATIGAGTFTVGSGQARDWSGSTDTLIDIERVRGTNAADYIRGSDTANSGNQRYQGLGGNDTIVGGGTGLNQVSYERDGNYGGVNGVTVNLGAGTATDGFGATDTLVNINGVVGTNFSDLLIGSDGNNMFRMRGGNDTVQGGAGTDIVDMYIDDTFTGTGATVDLAAGTAVSYAGGTSSLVGIEDVYGSYRSDLITGASSDNYLFGDTGNDTIDGGDGDDMIEGGPGNNVLAGGLGDDMLSYMYDPAYVQYFYSRWPAIAQVPVVNQGVTVNLATNTATNYAGGTDIISGFENVIGTFFADHITGDAGDNGFALLGGNDTLDGGDGFDFVYYGSFDRNEHSTVRMVGINANDPNGVVVDLVNGTASDGEGGTDTLIGIEGVVGSRGADLITGNALDNMIEGGAGADTLDGGAGSNDELRYRDSQSAVQVQINGPASGGDAAGDVLSNFEHLTGSDFADQLGGDGGANRIEGGAGDDSILGGAGDDTLIGGEGNDLMEGGGGADTVRFGIGSGHDGIDFADGSTAEVERIEIGAGILPGNVSVWQSGNDLLLVLPGNQDMLSINGYFAAADAKATEVVFANGTVWNQATLESLAEPLPTAGNTAPTFDIRDGTALTPIGQAGYGFRSVVQADGKIIVATETDTAPTSDFKLMRFNADGTLDTTFGAGGQVTTAVGGNFDRLGGLSLTADGRIVISGSSYKGGEAQLSVLRYNADGSLDTTFSLDGTAMVSGVAGPFYGRAHVVQGDGSIVVAGPVYNVAASDWGLVRFDASGSLDTTFGSGGRVATNFGSLGEAPYAIALQANGKIVTAGVINSSNDIAVARHNADGSLDLSFGSGGITFADIGGAIDQPQAVMVAPDGGIVVVGGSSNGATTEIALLRFNAAGMPDSTFGGGDGILTTAVMPMASIGHNVVMQSDGKILVVGQTYITGDAIDFAVVRYNSDGSLDTSFGSGGKVQTDIGGLVNFALDVHVQPDGDILVMGRSYEGSNTDFTLARYNSDGTLDPTFAGSHSSLGDSPTYTHGGPPVLLDADITVHDAELAAAGNYAGATVSLQRVGAPNVNDVFFGTGTLQGLNGGGGGIADISYDGTVIGTLTEYGNGRASVLLNGNATEALVNGMLRHVVYLNQSPTETGAIELQWSLTDGNTGLQGTGGSLTGSGITVVNVVAPSTTPVLSIIGNGAVMEGGMVEFTLSRTGDTSQPLQVDVMLSAMGFDGPVPVPPNMLVSFGIGQASTTFQFFVVDDAIVQTVPRSIQAMIQPPPAPGLYDIAPALGMATVNVNDNDIAPPVPSVSITTNGNIVEGGMAVFTLTRAGDLSGPLHVDANIQAMGFDGPSPVPPGLGFDFAPGSATATQSFLTDDDALVQALPRSFNVALIPSATNAYTISGPMGATIEVADNDTGPPLPVVSVTADPSVTEGGTAIFTLHRTGDTSGTLHVTVAAMGTSLDGGNYPMPLGISGADFAAGAATTTIEIPIAGDAIINTLPRSLVVSVTPPAGGGAYTVDPMSNMSASMTVVDDDVLPTTPVVQLQNVFGPISIVEGQTFTFTATRTGDLGQTLHVDAAIQANGFLNGEVPAPPGMFTGFDFAAGQASMSYTFSTIDNAINEMMPRSVALTLLPSAVPNAYVVNGATSQFVNVMDNDAGTGGPVITLSSNAMITEGGTAIFTAYRTGDTSNSFHVDASAASSGFIIDPDLSGFTGFDFAAGSTMATVSFATVDDTFYDGMTPRSIGVVLTPSPSYGTMGPSAGVTVMDNDLPPPTPMVSIASNGIITEGGTAIFTLSRTGDTSGPLQVQVGANGMGFDGPNPVTNPNMTVSFAPGQATVTVEFMTIDDIVDQTMPRTIDAFIMPPPVPGAYEITGMSMASVVVEDNDASMGPASITLMSPGPVMEGNQAIFTFQRSGGDVNAPLTVEINASTTATDGTVALGNTPTPYQVTFAAGMTTAQFAFSTIDDTAVQTAARQISVAIMPPVIPNTYVLGAGPTTATIDVLDNDLPMISVSSSGSAVEGTTVAFTFTRTGDTTQPLTIDFHASTDATDGSVTLPNAPTLHSVTFAAGATTATFEVATINDNLLQAVPRAIHVAVQAPPAPGAYGVAPGTGVAMFSVLDNDAPTTVTVPTGTGSTTVETGAGSDTITVPDSQPGTTTTIDAGEGDNVVTGSGTGSADVTTGGGSDEIVFTGTDATTEIVVDAGGGNDEVIVTGSGSANVEAGAGDDTVVTGAGDDVVGIGDGNDLTDLGAGDDVGIAGNAGGDDVLIGGTGIDTLTYPSVAAPDSLLIDLRILDRTVNANATHDALIAAYNAAFDPDVVKTAAGLVLSSNPAFGADLVFGFENATGGSGDDELIGNDDANVLTGGAGSDSIMGEAGIDTAVLTGSGDTGEYDLTFGMDGEAILTNTLTGDVETLSGIEIVDFAGDGVRVMFVGASGSEFTTIQAGVDAAAAGNVVFLAAGAYAEAVTIDKSIELAAFGVVDLTGTTIALTNPGGVALKVDNGAVAQLIVSAAGAADSVAINDFGLSASDLSELAVLNSLFDAGVETVTWSPPGVNSVATRLAGIITVQSDGWGQPWATSTLVINGDTGLPLSHSVTNDDGTSLSTQYTAGVASSYTYGGSAGADTYAGTSVSDDVSGYGGNDTLAGGGGSDTLAGGADDDSLVGGAGSDSIDGGTGIDVAVLTGSGNTGEYDVTFGVGGEVILTNTVTGDVETLSGVEIIEFAGDGARAILVGAAGSEFTTIQAGVDAAAPGNVVFVAGGVHVEAVTIDKSIELSVHGSAVLTGTTISLTSPAGVALKVDNGAVAQLIVSAAGAADSVAIYDFGLTATDLSELAVLNSLFDAGVETVTWSPPGVTSVATRAAGIITVQSDGWGQPWATSTLLINGDTGLPLSHSVTNDDGSTLVTQYTAGVATLVTYGGTAGPDTYAGTGIADDVSGFGGNDTLSGGAGNDTLSGGGGNDLLNGGADSDTASFADAVAAVSVNLAAGTANGADTGSDILSGIENVIGGGGADSIVGGTGANVLDGGLGNDTLMGGTGNDTLIGGGGNDRLYGQAGADEMRGGAGNDIYYVDDAGDTVFEDVGDPGNFDFIQSQVDYVLAAGQEVEGLSVQVTAGRSLTGNEFANTMYGNAGDDTLIGGGGNDRLEGLGGADAMTGGAGDDTFIVTDAGDTVFESAGGGNDTVHVWTSWAMTPGQYIETVWGSGTAALSLTGNEQNNSIFGTLQDDTLSGGAGNDNLSAFGGNDTIDGGEGADVMNGSTGNNMFIVDNIGDVVNENVGGGTDTIVALANFVLSAGQEVENLVVGTTSGLSITGAGLANSLLGNIGNDTLDGAGGNDTIDGGDGIDTVSFASSTAAVNVDLGSGTASGAQSGDDTLISIEKVLGGSAGDTLGGSGNADEIDGAGGNDTISGGGGNDTLYGGAGDDRLIGQAGNDYMYGGEGNDTFVVDDAGDAVLEDYYTAGNDTVLANVDYELTAGSGAEVLAAATAAGRKLTGNEYANRIVGNVGDDWLIGGLGNDTLAGGLGNDTLDGGTEHDIADYTGAAAALTINLAAGTATGADIGSDTLISIEGATGGSGADTITGGAGANTISGAGGNDTLLAGAGNDTLFGGAGNDRLYGQVGIDQMSGGAGDDIYYVDNSADTVFEAVGEGGNDNIQSMVDYVLATGQQVEGLSVQTTVGRHLTGNEIANSMIGNAGDDTLDGGDGNDVVNGGGGNDVLIGGLGSDTIDGGAGADAMSGGDGNDRFLVDNTLDTVTEAIGQGTDSAFVYANWTATAGAHLETVRAMASGLTVGGNELANTMTGSTGADTLLGGGGNDRFVGMGGADRFEGGDGDDYYFVDNLGISVFEAAGSGTNDAVFTSVDFAVLAGQHIEGVQVSALVGRAVAGNELANTLRGNVGNDTLSGGEGADDLYGNAGADVFDGGLGDDRMTGGAGADTYLFGDLWGKDFVVDFENDVDTLDFSAVTGLTDFSQFNVLSFSANDFRLEFGGNTLRIKGNVDLTTIQDDIVF